MATHLIELTPAMALPFGDVALPLGDHFLIPAKEETLRGEFVDIAPVIS